MQRELVTLVILVVVLTLFGCGSRQYVKALNEAYELQKPVVIMTSEDDDRPDWTKETFFEDDGNMYFSGSFLNGSDYSVSIRCANAEAQKVAVQAIGQYIRSEFSEYVQGGNTGASGVDRYVEDGIATLADNVHVQGVRQKEIYYEEVMSPAIMQPTYNVFVMLEISTAEYMKAKADVLQRLRDRFADAGELAAKEKAETLLNELKEGVKHGV